MVDLEPKQVDLLERICAGPLISEAELKDAGALEVPATPKKAKATQQKQSSAIPMTNRTN
jgi:hypothetical protein